MLVWATVQNCEAGVGGWRVGLKGSKLSAPAQFGLYYVQWKRRTRGGGSGIVEIR